MIPLTIWESAKELQRFLERAGFPFCFIGGIAIQRWGEPRVTDDIDLTVLAEFGHEKPVIDAILNRFQSRVADPEQFALQARILLVRDLSNTGIDISLGGMPFEERMVSRSTMWGTPGGNAIRTCSAEDLVVLKAFANRPQDWIDIERIVIRKGPDLNREQICEELAPLVELKEEPEILEAISSLFEKCK